jgi:membrane associated rhomboid family serine protease
MLFFIPYGTKETAKRLTFPYVNVSLVVINIAIFVYEVYLLATGGSALLGAFTNEYAAIPYEITHGSPFETGLITSMFLHGGLLHIAGNMIYLLPFGDNLEERFGHFKYLLFYLLCGVIATAGFSLLNPDLTAPLLGASGAIAGVLGGYIALHPKGTVKGLLVIVVLLTRLDLPAIIFIGYWLVLQLFSSFASFGSSASSSDEVGNVAYSAHLIGFLAGLILMPLFVLWSRRGQARPSEEDDD